MNKTKVYYNSACPVCKAGIENQQCRLAAQGVTDIEWLDVHADPKLVQEVGADLEFVRERLHVTDADGSIHVGMGAIALLLQKTNGQKSLARVLRWWPVRKVAELAYNGFARFLYRWNRAKGHW